MDQGACVYRFFDGRGSLLYVGVTTCLPRRLREHASSKPWWSKVVRVDVEHFPTLAEAQAAETKAIKTEGPLYNKTAASVGRFRRKPARGKKRLRCPGLGSCEVDPEEAPWRWRCRATGGEISGYLRLYWEVERDPITDDFSPEEVSASELWKRWAETLRDPERTKIYWSVICPEEAIFEAAPFTSHVTGFPEDFLTFFTWPERESTGELLNWLELPVVDKRWVPGNGNKGGFIQEATGWKPAPFQETVNVLSLAKAARLPMPSVAHFRPRS